jgi:hypothetical protein
MARVETKIKTERYRALGKSRDLDSGDLSVIGGVNGAESREEWMAHTTGVDC